MIETLSPEQMLSIGQQIGWPQLGDVPAGEAGWREVADAGEQALWRGLPLWFCSELFATAHACGRYRRWEDAGRPGVTADLICRLRFVGGPSTESVLRSYLLDGPVPACAVWYVVEYVAVVAMGDVRGIAATVPPTRYERMILLNDRDLGETEIVSCALHEMAHCFLMPPIPEMSDLEDRVMAGPAYWQLAERCGTTDRSVDLAMTHERQACALAKKWGASGIAADGDYCSRGPREEARQAALSVRRQDVQS